MSNPYAVIFEMPDWVTDGIQKGMYETVGGVIRTVDTKQVVTWLRPASSQIGSIAAGAPLEASVPLIEAFQSVSNLAAVAASVSILNTAVSIAGFALVLRRIEQVSQKIDKLLVKLETVDAKLDWLTGAAITNHFAIIHQALYTAGAAEKQGHINQLAGPLGMLAGEQLFFAAQMEEMLASGNHLSRAAGFVEFARVYVCISVAKARAESLFLGPHHAEQSARQDAERYGSLRTRFLAPLDDPSVNITHLVRLTTPQRNLLREYLQALPSLDELEYLRLPDMREDPEALRAFREAVEPAESEPAALIVVRAFAPPDWSPPMNH